VRKFRFEKLVRDKIVENIKSAGNKPVWHTLSQDEYISELKRKVGEEAAEINIAQGEDVIKELADVQELIDTLLEELSISKEEFEKVKEKKNEKAGAFKSKQYVEYVETEDGSEWVDYYLKSPDKYPEISE
jgi:predicted house-cleaning noncanonical NTP pyrophosphatase (MazG superfamily)